MIHGRQLERAEIPTVWTLDRAELIEQIYHLEDGRLVLRDERHDMKGWPPGEAERYTPILLDCLDRGGWFHGLFDPGRLVGVVGLDPRPLGPGGALLQLKFLYVDRAWRGKGLGKRLFDLARLEARRRGASGLYISSIPSRNTVDFYLGMGCRPAREVDPELFALEPEDIHMECGL